MDLPEVWFIAIAVLFTGYVFLEGFDFGVGMLVGLLGRGGNERTRRVLINTIGPVWDGNEVWMIVAVGSMFAAFPQWYAALLSATYLPMLAILLALSGRGVAFEYRGKLDSPGWRRTWDACIVVGSWVPPLAWGAILAVTVTGLPLDAQGNLVGGPAALLGWPALIGALAAAGFSLLHGAVFVTLKTEGEVRTRARRLALRAAPICLAPLLGWFALSATGATVVVAAGAAAWLLLRGRPAGGEAAAFVALAVLCVAAMATAFAAVYPAVLPSTLDSANSLTVSGAAAAEYPLQVVSWVALAGLPAVLVYQAWSYWVFRKRIATAHIPVAHGA